MTDHAAAFEIDLNLLADPLAFMEADHDRIAAVCDRLQALVNDLRHAGSGTEATALLRVLNRDLMDHIADEEDLFQMLEEGGKADDGVRSIIRVLRDEHTADEKTTLAISAELQRFIAGDDMQAPARFFVLAASFTENQRRHLTWENCTIIPAARRLLGPQELEQLSAQMRDRRARHDP